MTLGRQTFLFEYVEARIQKRGNREDNFVPEGAQSKSADIDVGRC